MSPWLALGGIVFLALPPFYAYLVYKLVTAHHHKWRDTRFNRWFISTEQRCACGAARHVFDIGDFDWDTCQPKWRDGPHPWSEQANAQ